MKTSFPSLRRGQWVRVRSAEEIRGTLDERGRLDGMPFMPEMLPFCGQVLRVASIAHKTCDTIDLSGLRHVPDTVHLEGSRCSGAAHGGCEARCLIFWKTAWVEPTAAPTGTPSGNTAPASTAAVPWLDGTTSVAGSDDGNGDGPVYNCQATGLLDASRDLPPGELRQYWWDVRSGNVAISRFVRYFTLAVVNKIKRKTGGRPLPHIEPRRNGPAPRTTLDLQPGELCRVRPLREIEEMLGKDLKTRGLSFDVEMMPHCGQERRVLARVDRIVNEKTGRMMKFGTDCLILEDVVCSGDVSCGRLFCPREITPYWREAWLERVGDASERSDGVEVRVTASVRDATAVPHSGH